MSRVIKFRVWDEAPNKDGYPGIMIDHDYIMKSDYLIDAINGKYPIMQFTGLLDKNGKEIYEGDFVFFSYNYIGKIVVKFENGKYNISGYVLNKCEVMGNVYENPELLKR